MVYAKFTSSTFIHMNDFILEHDYIYSHSLSFNMYTNSHSTTYFLVTNIYIHIRDIYSFTFKVKIFIQHCCYIHSTCCGHPPLRIIGSEAPACSSFESRQPTMAHKCPALARRSLLSFFILSCTLLWVWKCEITILSFLIPSSTIVRCVEVWNSPIKSG